MITLRRIGLLMFVFVAACGSAGDPSSGEILGDAFLKCADVRDDGTREKTKLSPLVIERDGTDVHIKGLTKGLVVLGVIAGISEPEAATKKNVDLFLEHFKEAGVQAILVPGGVGMDPGHVREILRLLAKAPVPILVVPGEQENYDVFHRTIGELRKKSPQLIDMTTVRRVRIGNLQIVSLPGYYKPFYLKAGERGCSYEESDIEATLALFEKESTGVLLSPTPPRGRGPGSVDRARAGVNIGDPRLTEAMGKANIAFGLFGYVYEGGGHATLADGRTSVSPGIWQESLFLQTGAAEATPITTTGEGRAAGMAQIVEFSGGRARYRTVYAMK